VGDEGETDEEMRRDSIEGGEEVREQVMMARRRKKEMNVLDFHSISFLCVLNISK
jgi:hypothetical protein